MARTESSVATSLQLLMAHEEERKAEQVTRAHHLKQQQDRLIQQEHLRRAEEAQRRAEAAAQEVRERTEFERSEQERLQRERTAHLESVRAKLELDAKLTCMTTEQRHELERLTLIRDARVRALEGQRGLLVALLTTLFVGSILIYVGALRPAAARYSAELVEQGRANSALRHENDRQREAFTERVAEVSSQLNGKEQLIESLRKELAVANVAPKSKHVRYPTTPQPTTRSKCTCDKNDPLCDCW